MVSVPLPGPLLPYLQHPLDGPQSPHPKLLVERYLRREVLYAFVELLQGVPAHVRALAACLTRALGAFAGRPHKLLLRRSLLHLVNDPGSVATINLRAGLATAHFSNDEVLPTWSATLKTRSSHSGWARTSASGYLTLSSRIFLSENSTCTMHVPGHKTISRPVFSTR